MKAVLFFFVLFFCVFHVSGQSSLLSLQDKLIGLTPDSELRNWTDAEEESIKEFWRIFKEIRAREIGFEQLKGSASFGFTGNSSKGEELFRLNGGISLSKGTFPQEFDFSTLLNISVDNGELQENLSNLNITYDRHVNFKKHPFLAEAYTFVNRRSNAYLGVNQRYEIGAGMIFAHWSKKLHPDALDEYNAYNEERIKILYDSDQIIVCENDKCVPIKWEGLTKKDSAIFHRSQERIANSIIKRSTPLRIGLLVGAFLEVESISHEDSLLTQEGVKYFSNDFETSTKFRLDLRPTIDFRIGKDVRFKIRPYFKLPLPGEWTTNVDGQQVVDYRIECPVSFSASLSDKFGLNFSYTLFYDNAPNSYLVSDLGPSGVPLYLTANKVHHFYNFQVTYQFR
ncbi:MAG: hypothetical protein AAF502_11890 [Bacteroidota bacterium]